MLIFIFTRRKKMVNKKEVSVLINVGANLEDA
jgi:hypothetical protein